jgi:hypothetical protein
MKVASPELQGLLGGTRDLAMADLWSIMLRNGAVLHYTSWDTDLLIGGVTYKSHDVVLKGGQLKQTRGLEPNETDLTCYPNLGTEFGGPSRVGNVPFLEACVAGLLDRAIVQRQRVFCPGPANPQTFSTYGPVRVFLGEVTEFDQITRNMAVLKCKDETYLLNIYMPRRQYMPSCAWTFGDSNCTFNKASLAVSAVAGVGSTQTSILAAALTQAAGYFAFGTVKFTGGLNAGVTRSIQNFMSGTITLSGPFPQPIAAGDPFTITPGCSKNLAGATESFNGSVVTGNSPIAFGFSISDTVAATETLTFTSGALNGLSGIIAQVNGSLLTMAAPFPSTPAINDTFMTTTTVDPELVVSALSSSIIPVGLPNADGFFNGGTLLFTSGVNVGQSQPIVSWANGIATVSPAFGDTPGLGDACTLTTVPQTGTNNCTYYNNTLNFGGTPFVPIPETAY